ncbi:MAG: molybdenum cofactor biosynthesis protein MoaE [Smithella sp.]
MQASCAYPKPGAARSYDPPWSTTEGCYKLVRRIGLLQVSDRISLVAVSSSASSDAFEACQYGLSRIRKMSIIKKTELFLD